MAIQLEECPKAQRKAFDVLRVAPYSAPFLRRHGLGHVLVVAHLPSGLLYYEDIEEGFETGVLDVDGVLHDHGCNQLTLSQALARAGI